MQSYGFPGWAAASAGNMHKLAASLIARGPFPGVSRLAVWCDGEAGGIAAGRALRDAARSVGMVSDVFVPLGGDDFADDLARGLGAAGPELTALPAPAGAPGEGDAAASDIPAAVTGSQAIEFAQGIPKGFSADQLRALIRTIIFSGIDEIDERRALEIIRRKTGMTTKIINGIVRSLRSEAKPTASNAKPEWTNHPDMQLSPDTNEPKGIMANVEIALENDPVWIGTIGFNEFTGLLGVRRQLPHETNPGQPCERSFTDIDELEIMKWIQRAGIHAPRGAVFDAVQIVADRNKYHPVRENVDALVWDKVPRLDTAPMTYFGCEDTLYTRAIFSKWMISGVARIMQPGCKADCVLILEGDQGIGKSTAFSILADPWFTDQMPAFGTADAAMQIRGIWIIELSELDTMTRSDLKTVNAFMSRSKDRFRPPYGRQMIDVFRQCIFGGSTNESEYLRDNTGARRYWSLACASIDKDALRRDRLQLWAEAAVRYKAGEHWWLEGNIIALSKSEADQRFQASAYEPDIKKWLENVNVYANDFKGVTVSEILRDCLYINDRTKWRSEQMKVSEILKRLGWVQKRGSAARAYYPLVSQKLGDQRLK